MSRYPDTRWLALPEGFQYVVFGLAGDEMTDGNLTPQAHDGMAAFTAGPGRVRPVRNHEIRDPPGSVPPIGANPYDQAAGSRTTTLQLLIEPYCGAVASSSAGCSLVALRPLEPFSVRMKASLLAGLFFGGRVIFFQLWRFITPGLRSTERRYALPFVVGSQLMFALGIVFAYWVIPQGPRILLGMGGPQIVALLSASEYLSFMLTTSVAFGLVFELPLVLIFLSLAGLVHVAGLRRARPYAGVAMLAVAAVVTPTTDAITLLLMAAPCWCSTRSPSSWRGWSNALGGANPPDATVERPHPSVPAPAWASGGTSLAVVGQASAELHRHDIFSSRPSA